MTRRFTAQHVTNGYAAMGNHHQRPRYGQTTGRSVAAEAAKAAKAARQRAAAGSKKK